MLNMGLGSVTFFFEMRTLFVFAFFADVEALDGSVIAHDPGIDKAFCSGFCVLFKDGLCFRIGLHNRFGFGFFGLGFHRILGRTRARH
jgi:hypothetical protein